MRFDRKGRAIAATSQTIQFRVADAERSVPLADVMTIETLHRDAPWQGVVYGATAGAGIGAVVGLMSPLHPCRPQQFCFRFSRTDNAIFGLATGALFGAPVGVLIDLLRLSSRTVYRAPGDAQVSVVPLLTPGAIGARAAIRW